MRNILCLSFLLWSTFAFATQDYKSCVLPADQGRGSLAGSWQKLPIHLTFDREFYRPERQADLRALKNAARTWNDWAAKKGKVAFVIDQDGTGAIAPTLASCSQSDYTEAFRESVGVWLIGSVGDNANKRPSCGDGSLLVDSVRSQVDWNFQNGKIGGASVLINFDTQFGVDDRIDLESNFLQDLGYVLGLLHSCNGSGPDRMDSTTAPHCSVAPAAYREAVMSPFLEAFETRRKLTANDIGRVNCLY